MQMDEVTISNLIRELKLTGKQVHSNCFLRFCDAEKKWEVFNSTNSILIVKQDNGVQRLFFFTIDFLDLKYLLESRLFSDREYVMEIVSKEREPYRDNFMDMGFFILAQMQRMSVRDVSSLFQRAEGFLEAYDDSLAEQAVLEDIPRLQAKLWEIFDTRISHLPNEEELREAVLRGEFCVCRDSHSNIQAFLQSVTEPRSFYINQVYNGGEKKIIHSIMHKRLSEYCQNGGKYVYAWVDEKNKASLRFHEKYGLRPDGLRTCVYQKGIQENNTGSRNGEEL